MGSPEHITSSAEETPPPDVEREIRFAVVMYGGVSLAIYINGVTQELLHMVRATARNPKTNEMLLTKNELSPSEIVYRKVAKRIDEQLGSKQTGDVTLTRFIVDVISGTSAGGINGVFLAKALARNQTMEGLKTLWLTEGDLSKLLNDTKAEDYAPELGFAVQKPERSLLNSQRMYRKLLEALEQMGASATPGKDVPLVNELDLFVTTTDIEGIPLPIRLADKVIYERRYRSVFHFRCDPVSTDPENQKHRRDDFRKENDPFLAFAARCTSSFPFAFDAMQLSDIKTILDRYHFYEADDPMDSSDPEVSSRWDRFIKDYLRLGLIDISRKARGEEATGLSGSVTDATKQLRKAFRDRSFGDGGYLDNKPFSYATSLLTRRSADCVIDRKLIYVEPTPEHPELAPRQPEPRPDFAANVRAAVLDLPREETIREDIERVYERNDVVKRVANYAKYVDQDASAVIMPKPFSRDAFAAADLDEMIGRYGASYGAYHRLKVHEITELLACIVTRALGHDPASDAGDAIRELVTIWRNDKYARILDPLDKRANGTAKVSENQFLLDYDIHYALRRLAFVNSRINSLAGVGQDGEECTVAESLLLAWLDRTCSRLGKTGRSQRRKAFLTKFETLRNWLRPKPSSAGGIPTQTIADPKKWITDFRHELNAVKRQIIAKPIQETRFAEEQFLDPDTSASKQLSNEVSKLEGAWQKLEALLSQHSETKKKAVAEFQSEGLLQKLDVVADILRGLFNGASRSIKRIGSGYIDPTKGGDAARRCLEYYYKNFLLYDLITYPIQYGTGAGEANIVQIYRVSPEDASTIMEEKAGAPREKLAGRALMSFGAFLDESWRKNDMLWGRLDGAERLISILLARRVDDGELVNLTREAHIGILREEILQGNGDAVCRLLSNALAHADGSSNEHLQKLVDEVLGKDSDLAPYLTEARRNYLVAPEKLDRLLDAERALRYISRSTTITGNMLDGLADQHRLNQGKRMAGWVSRIGATFWNMVAVAVPQSLGNIFFRHWLGLLYLFSAVLILAGIMFKLGASLGWELLAATVSLQVVVLLLGDFIAGTSHWLRAARRIGIVLVAILVGSGAYFLSSRSFGLIAKHDSIIGAIAGLAVFALLGFVEWRRWLINFLRAPLPIFSYSKLFLLTLATFAVIAILLQIGPGEIVGLEFAGTQDVANRLIARSNDIGRWRTQLVIDFVFIVAYAAMLASYCVAGAKLFLQRHQHRASKPEEKPKAEMDQSDKAKSGAIDENARPSRFFYALVIVGFAVAGLQWVAAAADATENVGLLWYLNEFTKEKPDPDGLRLAYWSATLKFVLIALGGTYAAFGFIVGAWRGISAPRIWTTRLRVISRAVFVLVSVVAIYIACYALFVCRPNPEACRPPVSSPKQESH